MTPEELDKALYNDYAKENHELRERNLKLEKALIRLMMKHHYDTIIIDWEEVIYMGNYKVVEKKEPKEVKLF